MQKMTLQQARVLRAYENDLAHSESVLRADWLAACQAQDKDWATSAAKALRNRLHEDSDKYVVVGNPKAETWMPYKEALRGIDSQEGFPFDISWPEKPE